jgi:N-acetylglucosaminyl-diphospho-decaprenol L-rhamnosyltransferase
MASAVIPHRNSGELLARCVDALERANGIDEVVVVDEGSTDGSADAVHARPLVRVLPATGVGFAAAMNDAVAAAGSDRLLLLNSDAFVEPDTVMRLLARLDEHPRLALCGAGLIDGEGRPTKSHAYLLTLRRALLDALGYRPELRQTGRGLEQVEAVFPTCAAARREALDAVGGFDPRFPFYYEDMDLCRRLKDAGWEQAVDWEARAVHLEGGSTKRQAPTRWFEQYHRSRLLYLRKHHPRGAVAYAALWFVKAGLHALAWSLRALAATLRSDRPAARLALRWAGAFGRAALPRP